MAGANGDPDNTHRLFFCVIAFCNAEYPLIPIPSVGSTWVYKVTHSQTGIYSSFVFDSLSLLMESSFPANNVTNLVLKVHLWYHPIGIATTELGDTTYLDTGYIANGRLINFKNPAWSTETESGEGYIQTAAWSNVYFNNDNYYLWNYEAIAYSGLIWIKDKIMIRDSIGVVLKEYDRKLLSGPRFGFGCILTSFNGIAVDTSPYLQVFQLLPIKNNIKPIQIDKHNQLSPLIAVSAYKIANDIALCDLKGRRSPSLSIVPPGILITKHTQVTNTKLRSR